MMGQRPEPKGDITPLWSLLGVDFGGNNVVWQNYNPYPKLSNLYEEFVFVDQGQDKASKPFNETDVVTSGLQQLLFVFPGSVSGLNASKMKFDVLVETGTKTGTVEVNQIAPMAMFGMMQISDDRQQVPSGRPYVLAARIQGELPAEPKPEGGNGDDDMKDESGEDAEKKAEDKAGGEAEKKDGETTAPKAKKLDVILVSDIDMLHRAFFSLREQGDNPEAGLDLRFDNVTFVLNVLDSLAGDDRFIEIRKRRPVHRTLTAIERATEDSRKKTAKEADRLQKEYDDVVKSEQKKLDDKIKALEERMKKDKMGSQDVLLQVAMAQQAGQKRLDAEKERLKAEMEREQNQIDTKMNLEIERVQDTYKLWAVLLPPILPLLIAVFVFISRRLQEKEGVARSRLR